LRLLVGGHPVLAAGGDPRIRAPWRASM